MNQSTRAVKNECLAKVYYDLVDKYCTNDILLLQYYLDIYDSRTKAYVLEKT